MDGASFQREVGLRRRRTYLIQDPYDDDAVQFIRTLFTCFGLRPVCFYTNRKARFYGERQYPILLGDKIEARYDVDLADLASFADEVRKRYEILGVIPYREDTVEVVADLVGLLGLGWSSRETLRRFRDKHALKSYLRERDPGLRVPASRFVHSPEDVWDGAVPEHFVIKPNAGFGNQHIGVFQGEPREAVAAHLARRPGETWILEEYIAGTEFHINGQVRPSGDVQLLGLLEYVRTEANGYPTVYLAERQCHTGHPAFAPIAEYARRLIHVSGLRGCPFHMEVKVDERGPCLIDVGARFPSEGGGHMLSRLHPRRPDVYTVAAHDYLGVGPFAEGAIDWSHHDAHTVMLVYGISSERGIIRHLEGVEEIERLPEFVNWPRRPRIGNALHVTRELGTEPYSVELVHEGTTADSVRLAETVHRTLRINGQGPSLELLEARAAHVLRRAGPKLRWLAHSVGLWPS